MTDTDDATTQLIAALPPVVSGAAALAGDRGRGGVPSEGHHNCVTKQFKLDVTGREIAKVTFTVDGKVKKVLSRATPRGCGASRSTRR